MSKIKTNIRLLILSMSLMAMSIVSAEEEIIVAEVEEAEEVKEYIQDLIKDFSRFEGFFQVYRDP